MLQSYKNWCWQLELATFLTISGAIIAILGGDYALAQNNIVPDSTLGAENSTVAPLTPGSPIDEIQGGAIRGTNLFHSFLEFNVGEGQGAYFYSPNANIQNILARVTGSNRSEILGTIGTSGNSNPNLFLINPNGIIFGKNASLNVGGSFIATTANAIGFSNQGFFSVGNPNNPPLLTVNPSAFLFNQIAAAPMIQNNSAAPAGLDPSGSDSSGLRVPNGQSLLLVGGNIDMNGGRLNSFGGRVELGGLAGAGTVGLNVDGKELSLSFPDAVQRANVLLSNDSSVDVRASGGGNIAINAGTLDISGSNLFAGIGQELGTVSSQAGDITLNATEAIRVRQSSIIANDVDINATGNSGDLIITTGSLFVTDGSQLSVSTYGQGNGGSVLIDARNTVSFDESYAYSTVESGAVGNGGGIDIKAGSLALKNGAVLVASTSGQGDAGSITITARDQVSFDGVDSNKFSSGVFSTVNSGAVGNGGGIDIKAGSLFLRDGAQLQTIVREASDTLFSGQGNAGNINIAVRNTVSFDGFGSNRSSVSGAFSSVESGGVGKGGDINITAEFLSVSNSAGLIARMLGQGNAGSINIKAEQFSLSSNALLEGDLDATGQGRGANINLDVKGTILLVGGETAPTGESTRITLGVLPGGIGSGGDLNIKAGSLVLKDGAIIKTSSQGQGFAGNIQINADVVDISGSVPNSGLPSGLFSSTDTAFRAGDITVNTRTFRIADGAAASARSRGDGQGGDIRVNATSSFEAVNGGQLVTTTFGKGQAGNIFVNATDRVTISGSDPNYANRIARFPNPISPQVANAITETGSASGLFANTDANSAGLGGGIEIMTGQLTVRDGAQVNVSSEGTSNAGSLTVEARSIFLDNQGKLQASTASGEGGNINLQVQNLILMRRNSVISAQAFGTANGGNIRINSPDGFIVAVPSENSDIIANAFRGQGGNINITTSSIYGLESRPLTPFSSDINASSQFGVNGSITINTPDVDPSGGLINLPTVPLDTEVSQVCQPRTAQNQSSFIITGRGGLPPNPRTEPLSGEAVQVDWVTLKPSGENRFSTNVLKITSSTPAPIVEAQGWMRNAKGEVVLTAYASTATPHGSWHPATNCGASKTPSKTIQ